MQRNYSAGHRRRSARGFSLIEVMMGVFAAGMCAAIVAATMPIANSSRAKANDINKAMGLAQKELEAIRGQGYPNIDPLKLNTAGLLDNVSPVAPNTYSFTKCDTDKLDSPAKVLTDGKGTVRINNPEDGVKEILITVSWREMSKRKSVQLGTLVANL